MWLCVCVCVCRCRWIFFSSVSERKKRTEFKLCEHGDLYYTFSRMLKSKIKEDELKMQPSEFEWNTPEMREDGKKIHGNDD